MNFTKVLGPVLLCIVINACTTQPVDNAKILKARRTLIEEGVIYTKSCFIHSAAQGNIKQVQAFLDAGMDINAFDNATALHAAVFNNNFDMVKFLIGKGADVNKVNYWGSPLLIASRYGYTDITKYLIEHGADINYVAESGTTPLMAASKGGYTDIVNLLVEHGVKIDNKHAVTAETSLSDAVYNGKKAVVEVLIKKGADVNYVDRRGMSILDWSMIANNGDIAKILVANGARVNLNQDGRVPEAMLAALAHQNVDMIKFFISKGVSVNGLAYNEMPILIWCTKNNLPQSAITLIQLGADKAAKDKAGSLAIAYAIQFGQTDVVKLLDPKIDVAKLPPVVQDPNVQSSEQQINALIGGQYYKAEPLPSQIKEEDKTVLTPSVIGNPVVGTLSGQGTFLKQSDIHDITNAKDIVQTVPAVNTQTAPVQEKSIGTETLSDQQIQKEIEEINKSLDISADTSNVTPVLTTPPKQDAQTPVEQK